MKASMTVRLAVLLATGLVLLSAGPRPAGAQKRADDSKRVSKNGIATQKVGATEITLTYGRPSVKERKIWGGLVPYGKVWRAGADEATTITFSTDVKLEGQPVKAGTYSLFLLPSEGKWTVILNKVAQQWGAFNYDAAQDALRVEVTPRATEHQEDVTFAFEDVAPKAATVVLQWEKLEVPFKVES